MSVDILAALDAVPVRGDRRCKLGVFLDEIPANTEGRGELVRLVETTHAGIGSKTTRSNQNMASVLNHLGFETTENTIRDHRNRVCRCYR